VLTLSVFCPKQRGLEKKRERDRNQCKKGVRERERERESSEMVKKKADYFFETNNREAFWFSFWQNVLMFFKTFLYHFLLYVKSSYVPPLLVKAAHDSASSSSC